ncbi:MAG: hypothetical protein K0B09_01665 [Bacteroidales bacterium]|nr:hypothetical protein [Bacteroidales bacterium]
MSLLINASAGTTANYQLNFFGQLIMGLVYSLGYLPFNAVGLLLGFVMPGIWVFSTYRLIRFASHQATPLPFPQWMQKDPGNILIIAVDLFFLAIIWTLILSGIFDKTWVKILFTVAFPLLTLSMLRNLLQLLSKDGDENNEA